MFRLFLLLNLFIISAYACDGGYLSCQQKLLDSESLLKEKIKISIKKNQRLLYSRKLPNADIVKYDQFLSLYLVKDKKGFAYPFRFGLKPSNALSAINNTSIKKGKITEAQVGLNSFASFSNKEIATGLLSSSCCDINGFLTPDGVIEREYLQHFLQSQSNTYSDVGIRVKQDKESVVVIAVDPYIDTNQFLKNDAILKHNGIAVTDAATLMKKILFSNINSIHKFQVKRDNKIINLTQKSYKRFGGGYISDTFLERLGIYVDKDLKIVRLSQNYKGSSLKLCDQIIQIDDKRVHNQQEIMQTITKIGKVTSLLIQRDSFQFFVKLN